MLSVLSGGKAHAATIDVAAGSDETAVNSNCSLSEAITNINNGDASSYPECASSNADPFGTVDTINLPSGTITLVAGLPVISASLNIEGQDDASTTINLMGNSLPSDTLTANADLVINNLKLLNPEGSAITVSGSNILTLNRVEITNDNPPVGTVVDNIVYISGGYLVANNLYIHDILNGDSNNDMKGIRIDGTVDSTISSLRNSTIAQIGHPAAAFVYAIEVSSANFTITNTTVANITSNGGIAAGLVINGNDAETEVVNSTISNIGDDTALLGAGIVFPDLGAITVTNTIISGTSGGTFGPYTGGSCVFTGATVITSGGGNLMDDGVCSPFLNAATDKNNLTNLKDFLAPIADNGGYVPTMALMQGSPAIDSGVTVAGLTNDARGSARPQGTAYDSGAYESPYSKPTSTSTLANTGENMGLLMMVSMATLASGLGLVLFRKFQS